MSAARADLHRLVDQLPETEVPAARRVLESLKDGADPVLRSLIEAPIDDEPEEPDEKEAVDRARSEESVSTDELKRILDS